MTEKKVYVTYYSLDEMAGKVKDQSYANSTERREWSGDVTGPEALGLARKGWTDQNDAALELAESAVTMAEREHMTDTFNPVWDVSGAEVDVARYLSGEPECMIDFPLSKTSKSGRVIALCASISVSGSVRPATIEKRGKLIAALALALSRLGHSTELWADLSGANGFRIRVLVKGANDELDPSRIMFAYAHPAMLRVLGFSAIEATGKSCMTSPVAPERNLPEGTIYLPEICSASDVPNADEFLRKYLGELGLLAE